ncbi:hypothetical protein ADUPG1_006401 [Aduncisulcus paluster]|uniref:Uncharacterized protein n=1 Tax=Aduncisulcus paluster TaxID=2918883 RepID=A0ABQ5KL54_9EUKA|nr:hypothetical protein ADUPG1_006401 [Aduncisulcus paluster]
MIKNLRPGDWICSHVIRDDRVGACQMIHADFYQDESFYFSPELIPISIPDSTIEGREGGQHPIITCPYETTCPHELPYPLAGGSEGVEWKQLSQTIECTEDWAGFFVYSIFRNQSQTVAIHGLSPSKDNLGSLLPKGQVVTFESVLGTLDDHSGDITGSVPGGWKCKCGWGSGQYPVFIARDQKGKAIAIRMTQEENGNQEFGELSTLTCYCLLPRLTLTRSVTSRRILLEEEAIIRSISNIDGVAGLDRLHNIPQSRQPISTPLLSVWRREAERVSKEVMETTGLGRPQQRCYSA